MNYVRLTTIGLFLSLISSDCNSQNNKMNSKGTNSENLPVRKAAVAGQFYPSNADSLKMMLKGFFSKAEKPISGDNLIAIISPHAGYVFSGMISASAINQINPNKQYDHIFIIGSSHRAYYEGAAPYDEGDFETPLGRIHVDTDLAKKLIEESPVFIKNTEAHRLEHSLEVQLPFLQYHLNKHFTIVPILLGTQTASTCEKIAEALQPYFNDHNFFLFSSDFSHYPAYNDAQKVDKLTADAIQSGDPKKLLQTLASNDKKGVPGLATSLCGWPSVLTLMYLSNNDGHITTTPVKYANSGDSPYGEKDRCVGYWAIKFTKNKNASESGTFTFSEKEKSKLLSLARSTIDHYLRENKIQSIDESMYTGNLSMKCGAFVSLHENSKLRGCIGRFTANQPLYKVVQEMAIAASTQDSRFSPVISSELNDIKIEISVLTPMKKIKSLDEIVLGKHGIYIKKGLSSGTFLPQVASETNWTKEEFLGHCAKDKAGLGWDGWKDAEIYTFEALVFGE
jgi:MEMO1 family protein